MKKSIRSVFLAFVIATVFVSGCAPASPEIPSTFTSLPTGTPASAKTSFPTDTPIPTTTATAVLELKTTYSSDSLGISLEYPATWFISQSRNTLLIGTKEDYVNGNRPDFYEEGECLIFLFVTSIDVQKESGDPVTAFYSYTFFAGVEMPDKEPAHMVTLGDKEYAIGTYSEKLVGGKVPLFTSIRFTDVNTIVTELYASPAEEEKFRIIFETLLSSIELR